MRREFLSVLVLAALAGCPGSGAGIGDPCGGNDDCSGAAQCLNGRCVRRCERAPECGDGYACDHGACIAAQFTQGDTCLSEVDCIAGLTCQINGAEVDPISNRLVSSCQKENAMGRATGAACDGDDDCRNGACDLGHCVDVCHDTVDCPMGSSCMTIPRVSVGGKLYYGCLKSSGVIQWPIQVGSPSSQVLLPVPSTATSAELVMMVDDPSQKVGASSVLDPCGCTRYAVPCEFQDNDPNCTPLRSRDQYYSQAPSADSNNVVGDNTICAPTVMCDDTPGVAVNRIRHLPEFGHSVLLIPSIPRNGELKQGTYQVQVQSYWPNNSHGSAIPHITAVVRIGEGDTLDLHFWFLDLTAHPCVQMPDNAALSAATARAPSPSPFRDDYFGTLHTLFGHLGIGVIDATYDDITNRHALDGLDIADAGSLFPISRYTSGINIFFVRSLSPIGVEVFGPNPGPAFGGTPDSGIVVSLDSLCTRDWPSLARLTAHALGRYMGLYHNVEPRDPSQPAEDPTWEDLIPDSDDASSNLMYPSAHDGTDLSNTQRNALIWSPVLR
ncbi:MAG TPA: hypothetical protein VIX73_12560 [Kofleriaceae bacterium]|jgi:hypothetical protein